MDNNKANASALNSLKRMLKQLCGPESFFILVCNAFLLCLYGVSVNEAKGHMVEAM